MAVIWDPQRLPSGEVTWFETYTDAVSTSGPCLTVRLDMSIPKGAKTEHEAVLRLMVDGRYLWTERADYQDPQGLLAVSAHFRVNPHGLADGIVLVVPYAVFPEGTGGAVTLEVAVHGPLGVAAAAWFDLELPEDLSRSPDPLTVIAHTLIALARQDGALSRETAAVLRAALRDHFQLDDLGDHALRRILKVANQTEHRVEGLGEALKACLPADQRAALVDLLYRVAAARGAPSEAARRFIENLLGTLGIHDHTRFGDVRLAPFYAALELAPGASLEQVKTAWRRLVRDYHPDKVQHLARGFQDYANEKVKSLNAAYDELKASLNTP